MERRGGFPSRLSLGYSAVETVLVGTVKCCCASRKFVPSIRNNSKERFVAVGTGCMKSSMIWGYVCFCSVYISSSPLYLFLANGGGTEVLEMKIKRSTCSEETYFRSDSPCIKLCLVTRSWYF